MPPPLLDSLPLEKLGAIAVFILLDRALTFYFVWRMWRKEKKNEQR